MEGSPLKRHALMRDALILLSKEESVGVTVQNRMPNESDSLAPQRDAPNVPKREECALVMELGWRSLAIMRDVPIKHTVEGCARDMEQGAKFAVMKDASTLLRNKDCVEDTTQKFVLQISTKREETGRRTYSNHEAKTPFCY